jgi:transcriptional regulator with XRE-family HTH domain
MLSINIQTPSSLMIQLKDKFKQKRLSFKLTQEGLASRSGVSLGSLKRFESSGQISLESLLNLALVLECLNDFSLIANEKKDTFSSIDDLIKSNKKHPVLSKRGKIK